MKGKTCKVLEIHRSKTGKHGHAKVHLVGIDVRLAPEPTRFSQPDHSHRSSPAKNWFVSSEEAPINRLLTTFPYRPTGGYLPLHAQHGCPQRQA